MTSPSLQPLQRSVGVEPHASETLAHTGFAARARNAHKVYNAGDAAVTALGDVSIDLPTGHFTAVMGPSGSGKSTLLHCMAGLDTLTSGHVLIGETDLASLSDRDLTILRRDRLGFVFQAFNLLPTLSAEENITLPADLAGRDLDRDWFDTVVASSTCATGWTPALGALRGPAAARGDRPRPDLPPRGRLRRRAHGCAGLQGEHRAAPVPALGRGRPGPDDGHGDPRPRCGGVRRPGGLPRGRGPRPGAGRPDPGSRPRDHGPAGRLTDAQVSLRNLLVNKLRLLLTFAAVTVGVAFVSGTFVLSDTMVKAFDELYTGLTSGTDVVVRSESAFDADVTTTGGEVRPLDERWSPRSPPSRASRSPRGGVRLRADHRLDGDAGSARGAPTSAPTSGDARCPARRRIREGRAPWVRTRSWSTRRTAEQQGSGLGDRVDVVFEEGRRTFTLVGVVGFGETDSLLGATLAGFDLPTAQRVLDKEGLSTRSTCWRPRHDSAGAPEGSPPCSPRAPKP